MSASESDSLVWKKSTASDSAQCVEIARVGSASGVLVRDSKDPEGPWLTFAADEWKAFLVGVRGGEFDLPSA